MTTMIALLLACGPEPVVCSDGFEMHDDGLCYEISEAAPTDLYEVWVDELEDCEGVGDGRLDLIGCVDGVCIGDTLATFTTAFGEADCSNGFCRWPNGVTIYVGSGSRADSVSVADPYDGTTEHGAGIGASTRCLVDEMGDPDSVTFEPDDEVLGDGATWFDPAYVSSTDGMFYGRRDGLVDHLYLGGGDS
jgi:hypothetical protein